MKKDHATRKNVKNVVFWDVALCRSCVNRRFGGTYRLHIQGRKIRERGTSVSRWLQEPCYTEFEQTRLSSVSVAYSLFIKILTQPSVVIGPMCAIFCA
jgi:hypothetical protein